MFQKALLFKPVFRSYLWGGHRLEAFLAKTPEIDDVVAESWEIVDHGADQSVVSEGPLAGKSLRELIEQYPGEILGAKVQWKSPGQIRDPKTGPSFPLLFKFLDCQRDLSVQVHPNDDYGLQMSEPDLGKTEAWYIVHAEPGSKLYAGLKPGIDRDQLAAAIEAGETEQLLHVIEPTVGDCVFIPAGTVHALGAGLIVAEIQQASDTTFRLFDWNRVDANGQSRPLHIEQALEVIDYTSGPVALVEPTGIPSNATVNPTEPAQCLSRLVHCDKFELQKYSGFDPIEFEADGRFRILSVVSGQVALVYRDGSEQVLTTGQTALIPAATAGFRACGTEFHDAQGHPTQPAMLVAFVPERT